MYIYIYVYLNIHICIYEYTYIYIYTSGSPRNSALRVLVYNSTCLIDIHVLSCGAITRICIPYSAWLNPVYDMDSYIFKVNIFTKQAEHELNNVFVSSFRVFNM